MQENEEEKNQALKFAMKLIGLRRRSEREIKERLSKKGFGEFTTEVMLELKKYGYIDDELFTESYINDRINFHPAGKFLIKLELKSRGISEHIIDKKMAELLDDEKELEMAQRLAGKKLKIANLKDPQKARLKILGYLKSKGFSSKAISQVMKNRIELDKETNLEN